MSITLPEDILARARKQAEAAGFADDVEGYVASLIEDADIMASIEAGLADAEAGRFQPAREVMAELARKYNISCDIP